jgi:branched-chain amino acid transport system ATP-binding protein
MPLLRVDKLSRRFGGVDAISDVTFDVVAGERVGIIGPNGAGKTTLFNSLIGQPPPTAGGVVFDGHDITHMATHARAGLGLARSFQSVSLLAELSVEDNALIAVSGRSKVRYRSVRSLKRNSAVVGEAHHLLERAELEDRASAPLKQLSYGEQRRLDLALTLAGSPKLFLLDEPSAGLTSAESLGVVAMVKRLPAEAAVLVIDHDMDVVFGVAERILVLNRGQVIAEGSADEIRDSPLVREVYLGGGLPVA